MSSSSSQRAALTQFMQFTQTPERTAKKILQANNWNLELAIDSYYQNPSTPSASGPTNQNAINAVFDQFRQPSDPLDEFSIDATMAYFDALGLQLDDVTLVPLSKVLGSESMGEINRKGFTDGWMQLGADSLPKMQEKLQELRQSLDTNEEYFKEVYKWAFGWAKPAGSKALPLDSATEWWRLLLQSRFGDNGHLERWLEFLNEKWKKSIPKDTWNMFYEFILSAKADPTLTGYDENGSYPSIIDAYVDYYRNLEQ
ncbi:Scaffold-type E3 ligase [Orbilia oligospora]|uniref:Defective in cullin neddylation protein n=1 Tax=Orbilia oligospora TaxID=2813651 RepID=A0A7C8KR39_ORBOL|nr:Scaffold-type E3 ligase [Orbilia oligospora]KAF3078185.1 Scaffold-type E3 ligase [Orbilia oligospora]KAF3127508.1 Scaffold-type E3 ligase [Orbilia oligospora]KAF3176335.1 Scaffold-type E3 ligase [Orbilia oligospora]KAF3184600.1 Scaffold-type E3 ligase [Orbilia oligospora]